MSSGGGRYGIWTAALDATMELYCAFADGTDVRGVALAQLERYEADAGSDGDSACRACGSARAGRGPVVRRDAARDALVDPDDTSWTPRYPLDVSSAASVRPRADHGDRPSRDPRRASSYTSRPSPRVVAHAKTFAARARDDSARPGVARDRGGQQRRLSAPDLRRGGRPGARHRPGAQRRRRGATPGASRQSRSSSIRGSPPRWSRAEGTPIW